MIKFLRFIPVQLVFFLVLGILFGNYLQQSPIHLIEVIGFVVLIFSIVYFYSNRQLENQFIFTFCVFTLSFLIGVSSITLKNETNKSNYYGNQSQFSIDSHQTAIISIRKVLKPTQFHYKYEASVVQLNGKESVGEILINVNKEINKILLKVDEQFLINSKFIEIKPPLNPYDFNYRKYLQNQQIHHQVFLQKENILTLGNGKTTLKGIAANFRGIVNKALKEKGFKDDELAVINALLLGQRQDISTDLIQSYTAAGAIHILAVSGLHVGIILLILTFLFKPLNYFKYSKFLTPICIVISLWIFALIAGLSPSVVRAVTMFTAITIGMYSNRVSNIYNTLIISMFFLLLINPNYLFEVGFQLSYLAVFSIVWIQPKVYNLWIPKIWLFNKIWQLFTVSLAAQIGVLPLSLFYFHQFPGLFFVSNLVIIPFLGIILMFGIAVIILSLLGIVPQMISQSYILLISGMNGFISFISEQEVFVIQNISFSFLVLLASYGIIFLMLKWTEKMNFQRTLIALLSVIFLQSVFIYEKYQTQSAKEFIIFNKSKESLIVNRFGGNLEIDSSLKDSNKVAKQVINYAMGTRILNILMNDSIQKMYLFNKNKIFIVDSLGLYKLKLIKPSIIVLRQSPKINLDRLIKVLQPKLIIADGSNYKSFIANFEESCLKNKTPFYDTSKNGAYILN